MYNKEYCVKKGVLIKQMNDFGYHFWTLMPRLWDGAAITIKITAIAVCVGMVIGMVMALSKLSSIWPLRIISNVYIECLRGTPLYVQILLFHFGVPGLMNSLDGVSGFYFDVMTTAIVVCSLNSGAYIAEIFRSGIQSIDRGQMEAGRSLGLSYNQTMSSVILPQAFKNVLPALGNEFIVLLKETSVSGYIALQDLTKAGDIIRSQTYDAFLPLIAVALIYLVLVTCLTSLLTHLENRLKKNE